MERKQLSQLYGSNLDNLPPQELALLADVHRAGLQRIQSLQVGPCQPRQAVAAVG